MTYFASLTLTLPFTYRSSLVQLLANYGSDASLSSTLSRSSSMVLEQASGDSIARYASLMTVDPRIPSMRKSMQAVRTLAGLKRRSYSAQCKFQTDLLVDHITRSQNVQFVFCLLSRSQSTATANGNGNGLTTMNAEGDSNGQNTHVVNVPLLRQQLRAFNLVPTIRFFKHSFPEFLAILEFRKIFEPLVRAKLVNETGPSASKANLVYPFSFLIINSLLFCLIRNPT